MNSFSSGRPGLAGSPSLQLRDSTGLAPVSPFQPRPSGGVVLEIGYLVVEVDFKPLVEDRQEFLDLF